MKNTFFFTPQILSIGFCGGGGSGGTVDAA
jgi:hypothetical protein